MSPRLSMIREIEQYPIKGIKIKRSKSMQAFTIAVPNSTMIAVPEILIV
jgi:hypothetical protein